MDQLLGDLKETKIIVDDIPMFGKGENTTEAEDYDDNLKCLLDSLREYNIKL